MEKVCYRCGSKKPVTDFPKNKRCPDGLNAECNSCASEKAKTCRIRRRWKVIGHYGGGVEPECECCKENTFEFLTIDHIHGGGNSHRDSVGDVYTWILRNDFPVGFRVLCMNCNNSVGWYGYCPHNSEGQMASPPPLRKKSALASMNKKSAVEIKEMLKTMSVNHISRITGKSRQTVQNIKHGRTWIGA